MKLQCHDIRSLVLMLLVLSALAMMSAQASTLSLRDRSYLEQAIFRRLFPHPNAPLQVGDPIHKQQQWQPLVHPGAKDESSKSDTFDYDDFSELPPFLAQYGEGSLLQPKGKRYLGIDIPDYIANGGKADALKHMSDKMKAMGRRRK
ncbi:uncharacterized protein LOC131877463 [Tigriopus californicus]|uniref:uncharacterized protein LOC131877463 n=1 Tax=Tigriopus californicus TaxID=6832 RepID=UPI0027D9E214|nr:uncharacterized protein LOC131877463 [Tigriopus californicus]